jgi:hypothetical protein
MPSGGRALLHCVLSRLSGAKIAELRATETPRPPVLPENSICGFARCWRIGTPVDKQQRVLPWWRVNEDGSYVLFVRVGSKLIEFEKGKNAVAVPSLDKMPSVINILITAVRNGELDQQLAQTKKPAVLRYLKTA